MSKGYEYKGFKVEEILEMGKVEVVKKVKSSLESRKCKNKGNEEVYKESCELLEMIDKWLMDKGELRKGSNGVKGKYDGMVIEDMSKEELKGYYESLYSRVSVKEKNGRDCKFEKERLERVKEVRKERMKESVVW